MAIPEGLKLSTREMEETGPFSRHCQLRFGIPMEQGPELMVVRGPKPTLLYPALRAEGPAAHTTHCQEPPGSQLPPCSPSSGVTGSTGRGWHLRPPGTKLFLCKLFVCGVCLCVCEGWTVAGGQKWSLGYGGKGGFSILLYLCNQREEKFLWLFLRMACSQDLKHLFYQQPLASFPGATKTRIPVDCRNSAK